MTGQEAEILTIMIGFSAALNLFSVRFICNRIPAVHRSLSVSSSELFGSFQKAVEVVESLRKGTRATAKCSECLKHLYQYMPPPGKWIQCVPLMITLVLQVAI